MGRAWMAFGAMSLLFSGALAFVITSAKLPMVKEWVGQIEIVRWCLVVHVNLATLVWFTSIPLGLSMLTAQPDNHAGQNSWEQIAGFLLAIVGVLLMVTAFPSEHTRAILVNYVPLLNEPRHNLGLIIYVSGVALSYLSRRLLLPGKSEVRPELPALNECRFGLWVGTMFFLSAVFTLVLAAIRLKIPSLMSPAGYFEALVWGPGHLLQHSSLAFLATTWIILHAISNPDSALKRSQLFPVFGWLGLPILALPIILSFGENSHAYRHGFTLMMQWGMAPPMAVLGFLLSRSRSTNVKPTSKVDIYRTTLGFSAFLLTLGVIYGALIRGPDMRVPGHYHSTIGAITIAFMAITYRTLAGTLAHSSVWMRRSIWTYGIGQSVFATGMFIAGSFGMGRKTYGTEHTLTHMGQYVGFGLLAAGGLVAFAGGFFFAFAVWPHLKAVSRHLLGSIHWSSKMTKRLSQPTPLKCNTDAPAKSGVTW